MKPGALRRVYFTHQHIICSLNPCKYKHFACKLLIFSILNKTRYNSICIKGCNSCYFLVISIYFHVLYIKTQEKKTCNLHTHCIPIGNILFLMLHTHCIPICIPIPLFNSFINNYRLVKGVRKIGHPLDGFSCLKPLYGLF